jgi:ATP-dependent Clp protease ATP-binding subunit ClpC
MIVSGQSPEERSMSPHEDDPLSAVISIATDEAHHAKAEAIAPVHLFIAVLRYEDPSIVRAFETLGIDAVRVRRRARAVAHMSAAKSESGPLRLARRVERVIDVGRENMKPYRRPLDAAGLFITLLESPDTDLKGIIADKALPVDALVAEVKRHAFVTTRATSPLAISVAPWSATPLLDTHCQNYTARAETGDLSVVGRREEVQEVILSFMRKQHAVPLLVGEPGVGRESIVVGLAAYLASPTAVPDLKRLRVFGLTPASLAAGARDTAELRERFWGMLAEAQADKEVVLFIHDLHRILAPATEEGGLNLADLLVPVLRSGAARLMGATTLADYRRHIRTTPGLEGGFHSIFVEEPSPEASRAILSRARGSFEDHHRIRFTEDAIDAAVEYAVKYLPDRYLPGKALDLLDQAAVSRRFVHTDPGDGAVPSVDRLHIAHVVANMTRIPTERILTSEADRLVNLESKLAAFIVGQEQVLPATADVLRASAAGMRPSERPRASFLFAGPATAAKADVARSLAVHLFDDERRMIRIDLAEYADGESAHRITDDPLGPAGYARTDTLIDVMRRTPFCVVFFDGVDQTHTSVLELLVRLLGSGTLKDSHGRVASFRYAVVILAARDVESDTSSRQRVPPDLIRRVDRVVEFRAFGEAHARTIAGRFVDSLRDVLAEKGIDLLAAPSAYDALVTVCYRAGCTEEQFEQNVDVYVARPIAAGLLDRTFESGDLVELAAVGSGVVVRKGERPKAPTSAVGPNTVLLDGLLRSATWERLALLRIEILAPEDLTPAEQDAVLKSEIIRMIGTLRTNVSFEGLRYLRSTDAGLVAAYPEVATALRVAHTMRRARPPEGVRVRYGLYWGDVSVGRDGIPSGGEVELLGAILRLTDADRADSTNDQSLPERDRVVAPCGSVAQLPEELRAQFDLVGWYRVPGIADEFEIWAESLASFLGRQPTVSERLFGVAGVDGDTVVDIWWKRRLRLAQSTA